MPRRSNSLPNLPTCAELGLDGFDIATMIGLQTSAGASDKIVARLQSVVAKAMRESDMTGRMATLGIEMQESGTASYQQFIKDDLEKYIAAVRKLNIQVKAQ